jgi:hypothetical protein
MPVVCLSASSSAVACLTWTRRLCPSFSISTSRPPELLYARVIQEEWKDDGCPINIRQPDKRVMLQLEYKIDEIVWAVESGLRPEGVRRHFRLPLKNPSIFGQKSSLQISLFLQCAPKARTTSGGESRRKDRAARLRGRQNSVCRWISALT